MQLALTGNNTGQKIILPNGMKIVIEYGTKLLSGDILWGDIERLTEEESDIYSADNPNLP